MPRDALLNPFKLLELFSLRLNFNLCTSNCLIVTSREMQITGETYVLIYIV